MIVWSSAPSSMTSMSPGSTRTMGDRSRPPIGCRLANTWTIGWSPTRAIENSAFSIAIIGPVGLLRAPYLCAAQPGVGRIGGRIMRMAEPTEKLSITMPQDIADAARARSGTGGLSAYVARPWLVKSSATISTTHCRRRGRARPVTTRRSLPPGLPAAPGRAGHHRPDRRVTRTPAVPGGLGAGQRRPRRCSPA